MTRDDVLDLLAERLDTSRRGAYIAYTVVYEVFVAVLRTGEAIEVEGLGRFILRDGRVDFEPASAVVIEGD